MVNIKRFLGIGKFEFNRHHAYRFDSLIWMILIPMFFLVEVFLWKSLFSASGQEVVNGFTFQSMTLYYFMAHVTMAVTSSNLDRMISYLVKTGKLIKFIIKPINFFHFSFIRNTWRSLIRAVLYIPPLIIAGYFLIPSIDFSYLQPHYYLISLILAGILKFNYIFMFGLFSFWLKANDGIRILRQGIAGFFTGMLIPLSFFPQPMQEIFKFLPFQYMLYVPVQIFLGNFNPNQIHQMLGFQVIWTIIFMFITFALWKKAFAKFKGVGV